MRFPLGFEPVSRLHAPTGAPPNEAVRHDVAPDLSHAAFAKGAVTSQRQRRDLR